MLLSDSDDGNDSFFSISSSVSSEDSFQSAPSSSLFSTLASNFSDKTKNFNIVHLNAQSIPAHFADLVDSFESQPNIHAILISESWLKPVHPSVSYSLPGFVLIRNDRVGRAGGGVAIYLRSNLAFKILSLSPQPPPSDEAEHLLLDVTIGSSKLLLGVFYSPHLSINYFPSFDHLLDIHIPSYDHVILMGDFNTCLSKNDLRSRKLTTIIDSYNLHLLPLNPTHHYPNSVPSLLDLIIVSSPLYVEAFGQCPADGFSYHDCIFLSYKLRTPKHKPKILMRRNLRDVNLERLRLDAENIDWTVIAAAKTIDAKVSVLNSLVTQLFDKHAPLRPVRIKHLPAPWLNDKIKSLIAKKNRARAKMRNFNTEGNRENYIKIRNRCNTMCRDAQLRYVHKSIENGDQAKTWKFLKSLGVGKVPKSSIPLGININLLNSHFSNSSYIFDANRKARTLNYLSTLTAPNSEPFFFCQLSVCDVKRTIMSISSKAVGGDCIGRDMILPILDIVAPFITEILNFSISTSAFPSLWKDAFLIPLPKKSNPQSPSDYRPISILPFLSKTLERLVHGQMCHYFNQFNFFNPLQSGFRPGHSTTTALVKITDDIRWGMDNKNLTILVLLDFSNAFNTVDHNILLSLLKSLNVSPAAVDWFRSFLTGRRQSIKLNDVLSSWNEVTSGVPQGSVLSPLLFSLFINCLSSKISSPYHMYADDVQVYRQAPLQSLSEAITKINCDLDSILEWSRDYGLNLNPEKTQAIIFGSRQLISKLNWNNLPKIKIDDAVIPYSSSVKNLGIHFDQNLSWSVQVTELRKKISAATASLRRLGNFLPIPTKILLSQALLLPILDYADVTYTNLSENQLSCLERLQNLCIRFIYGIRKYDHVSECRAKLRWLPIRLRRNTHILHLLYSILFSPTSPSYLKEKFSYLGNNTLILRSSSKLTLAFPSHKTSFFDSSFTLSAIRLWNALPQSVQSAQSLAVFKKRLKEYYLSL